MTELIAALIMVTLDHARRIVAAIITTLALAITVGAAL